MTTINYLELFLKSISWISLLLIAGFLILGWFKGLYREVKMQPRRRARQYGK